jgi:HNH endonuclease
MNEQSQQHFVAYHNADQRGAALWRGQRGSFETDKPVLPRKGDVLWCFEGQGRPKSYRLVKRGVVSRSERSDEGPSLVHYRASTEVDADVTGLAWFDKLLKAQGSFGFGVNRIGDPETIKELERFASSRADGDQHFTDLCAYTLKRSSDLETFADGREYTIKTGGKPWARIADILATKEPRVTVPVLFAPAERFAKITACAELLEVKTLKSDGVNSFTFANFRYLSPPVLKSSLKWYNGNPLGDFQRDYAICRTPADLARRLILAPGNESDDIAAIEQDRTVPETTRKALIEARRGQGAFRKKLDELWGDACAVTNCGVRDLLRASHIKPWRLATNEERLDAANGILLSANIDILFDKGFVSFDERGRMLVSPRLSAADGRLLGLPGRLRRKPEGRQRVYLAHHRKAFGFQG